MTFSVESLPAEVFLFLLIFARVGGALMVMPVFGEPGIQSQMRLALALGLSLLILPLLRSELPVMPGAWIEGAMLIIREAAVGLAIGGLIRFWMSALQVAGTIIATQSGLAFAMTFDPSQGTQGVVIGSFLSLLGVALLLASDLHHLLLAGVVESYRLFPASEVLPVSGFSALAMRWVMDSFLLGLTLAFPFVVFGFVFYAAMGVLSKLMPQLQIMFIVMPINITMGYVILLLALSAIMLAFLTAFEARVIEFLG